MAASAAIIIPPFADVDRPAFGPHLLQKLAQQRGVKIDIFYANLDFASRFGLRTYQSVIYRSDKNYLGDWWFARCYFGDSPKSRISEVRLKTGVSDLSDGELASLPEELATGYLSRMLSTLGTYDAIGVSTVFEQNLASAVYTKVLRGLFPDKVLIAGGSNCESEMANGFARLCPHLDYVFQGEAENSLIDFLEQDHLARPRSTIVVKSSGSPPVADLPAPEYEQYVAQLSEFESLENEIAASGYWHPIETSRGCWWGERSHCTFCGLNAEGMGFRQKTPEKAYEEIATALSDERVNKVFVIDNIMPHNYFGNLTNLLRQVPEDSLIFYEQKSNLRLREVRELSEARIREIQPGIESLSSPLLKLMKKGVSAWKNVNLLRFARTTNVKVNWNLLYGFPQDSASWYQDMSDQMHKLHHLQPPAYMSHLSIDRFSPYFTNPEEHGICSISPDDDQIEIFPSQFPVSEIAYHFVGDYPTASRTSPQTFECLKSSVEGWKEAWKAWRPVLLVLQDDAGRNLLLDTRSGAIGITEISNEQARFLLDPKPSRECNPHFEWALQRDLLFRDGDLYLGLAYGQVDNWSDRFPNA